MCGRLFTAVFSATGLSQRKVRLHMRLRRLLALILPISLILSGFSFVYAAESAALQDWIVYKYDNTNGLPTGEANTAVQTSDGYVWIGSYGGLIRFDGTSFHNYSEGGVFPSSGIRALFEDSGGRLWIGTNDMGVFYFENNEFTHIEFSDNTKFLSVRSFAEGGDGQIYVGATSGLAVVSEDNTLRYVDEEKCSSTVYCMARDGSGTIWACIDNGIALLVSGDAIVGSFKSEGHLKADIYSVGSGRDGTVYLGTSDSYIYKVEIADDSHTDASYSINEYSTKSISTINAVEEDSNGNVWVGGVNGVGYFDNDFDWHYIDEALSFSVGTISFDYEGNVWITSSSTGVIQLVRGMYKNFNTAGELTGVSVNSVTACDDGYYIGTDTGLLILDKDYRQVKNELTSDMEGERVRHTMLDGKGNIWISTMYQHGLVVYNPKTSETVMYNADNGLADNYARMTLELSDGRVAAATYGGVTVFEDGKPVKSFTKADGLTNPVILCLCEGSDGTLYAGSDGLGFYAIKDGEVTHYGFDEGLSSGVVLRMLPDEDGKGFFISAGNSLFYWDFKEFKKLDNYLKSPGSIFDIQLRDGNLWLMQSNGINLLNRERLLSGEQTSIKILGTAYGLTGTLNANTWNDERDGVFYLSTTDGISVFSIDDLDAGEAELLVTVNQVDVDGETFPAPTHIDVDGGITRLTFDFAPLSFSGKSVSVRYQLKGFDKEPAVLNNANPMSASYTNLRGGSYEFLLEVLDSGGENVIGSYTVSVSKKFQLWETVWFWILVSIVIIAAVAATAILFISVKTKNFKRRQAEYHSIINQSLRTFAHIIDAKDKYTNGHSLRVAAYSLELAKKLKLTEEEQERIYYIALLHDIGKIGIPESILNKDGKLTESEIEFVRRHPTIGGQILEDFTSIPGISDGARYHHERYDGKGYNEGLKGEEIPYFARIICVADCYDVMAGGRHYQSKMNGDSIKEEIKSCSGNQFDPKIAQAMLELIEEGKAPIEFEGNSFRSFYGDI